MNATGLDLTEAVDAAWRAMDPDGIFTATMPSLETAVAAAAPIIERQVRDRIAAEIRAIPDYLQPPRMSALAEAERIVRGGAA